MYRHPSTLVLSHYFSNSSRSTSSVHRPSTNSISGSWYPTQRRGGWRDPFTSPVQWKNASECIRLLESYLPAELRCSSLPEQPLGSETKQCQAILKILYRARTLGGFDALSYLGVRMGRWDAVCYIVNKLLDNEERSLRGPPRGWLPSNIKWGEDLSLDDITYIKPFGVEELDIFIDNYGAPLSSIELYSDEPMYTNRMGQAQDRNGTMDELWPSLGSIVLEAADIPHGESEIAMLCFYRIVARLHHSNFIPHEVYKYTAPMEENNTFVSRPPTLYLLSTRIMAVLSEAAWTESVQKATPSKTDHGRALVTSLDFRPRELGHEIWLEFVLWCCIEGGFAREGAWILEKMRKRDRRWHVENFPSFLSSSIHAIDQNRIDLYDTWLKCQGGTPMPAFADPRTPFIGIGLRTISKNTVIAVMDGLVNTVRCGVGHRGDAPAFCLSRIIMLHSILRDNNLELGPKEFTYLATRTLDTGGLIPENDPHGLKLMLNAIPHTNFEVFEMSLDKIPLQSTLEYCGFILGLYQYLLNIYARIGHILGAEEIFHKLLPKEIAKTKPQMEITLQNKELSIEPKAYNDTSELLHNLPPLSLSLLVSVSLVCPPHTLAYQLLLGSDTRPPIVPPEIFATSVLAPSIIRFAGIAHASSLLMPIAMGYSGGWPTSAIKGLFDYAVETHDWKNAHKLLSHLRDNSDGHWGVSQVMTLAATVVRLGELVKCQFFYQEPLNHALNLLSKILEGHFNVRVQTETGIPYYYQETTLHQLHEIFASVPGTLSEACHHIHPPGKVHKNSPPSRKIPENAFNRLLAAVAESHSSAAACHLWDRWCLPLNAHTYASDRIQNGGSQLLFFRHELDQPVGGMPTAPFDRQVARDRVWKMVRPNVATVRIVARQAMREMTVLFQRESAPAEGRSESESNAYVNEMARICEILVRCRDALRRFRLTNDEIRKEFGDYDQYSIPKKRRR